MIRAHVVALTAAGLMLACGPGEAGPAVRERGEAARALEAAASRTGVPMAVLAARGYQASRFTLHVDDADAELHLPARGRFGLTPAQLERAAQLAKHTPAELEAELELEAVGYALLLRERSGGDDLDALVIAAVELAGLARDNPAHAEMKRELLSLLADGVDVTLDSGERLVIAGTPVTMDDLGEVSAALVAPGAYPPMGWFPASPNNYIVGRAAPPKYVVIHVTEGYFWGTVSWFQQANPSSASTQYVIRSSDGYIAQMVSESNVAWHAGNDFYSRSSIGIEHEGFQANASRWYTEAMYQSSARLVCAIARKYGIPVDNQHIIGHFQIPNQNRISGSSPPGSIAQTQANPYNYGGGSNHFDPGYKGTLWRWDYYLGLVRACVDAASDGSPAGAGTGQVVCQGAACFATNDLESGNQGKAVYALQQNLVLVGRLTQAQAKASPGVFGATTQAAVSALQAAASLESAGYYGPKTAAVLKAQVLSHNLSALPAIDVWRGQTSSSVVMLQQVLNRFGAGLPTTGYYGQATTAAVLAFQTRQKVPGGDGTYVGPLTRAALAAAVVRGQ